MLKAYIIVNTTHPRTSPTESGRYATVLFTLTENSFRGARASHYRNTRSSPNRSGGGKKNAAACMPKIRNGFLPPVRIFWFISASRKQTVSNTYGVCFTWGRCCRSLNQLLVRPCFTTPPCIVRFFLQQRCERSPLLRDWEGSVW